MIPLDDRGFTLGDGLFETVLAQAGELIGVESHLIRLERGCKALGLPQPDRMAVVAAMRQALADADLTADRAAVRLTLTAGSGGRGLDRPAESRLRLVATAAASPKPATPARLVIAQGVRRNDLSPASRFKTLAYLDNVLAREEARAAGADEAVMLDTQGRVACAAAANLFWIAGETLFTPALGCGVLLGTMRTRVIARALESGVHVREAEADASALAQADAAFLTNSLIGVRSVLSLDDRSLTADHSLIARLSSAVEL